jgi:DNA-binding FadR family transcriptional regulator
MEQMPPTPIRRRAAKQNDAGPEEARPTEAKAIVAQPGGVVSLINRRNLHDQIVEELGRRIVGDEFGREGLLPTEPQLAAELGVSRNALREAIKVLVSKGLIEVRPKTGMRIRPAADWNLLDREVLGWHAFSSRHLEHSFDLAEFRLIIEPRASHLAAKRASAAEIAAIDKACTRLEGCVGKPDLVPEADIVFHRSILLASHNAILNHLGSLVSSLMQIQVLMTTQHPGSFERGLPLHRELAESIRRHDAPRAEEISRRLVQMPYEDLAERLRLTPAALLAATASPGKR